MYKFEPISESLDKNKRFDLAEFFHHEWMGEIALGWSELMRESLTEGLEIIYIKIYKEEKFIGLGIISLIRNLNFAKYFWQPLAPFFQSFLKFDVGFLEIPFSNLPGLLTVENIDHLERGKILNELYNYIVKLIKLDVLCLKIDSSLTLPKNSFSDHNAQKLTFFPNAILPYPYHSFEEYLQSLPRKKYRKCRSEMRVFQENRGTIEVCDDLSKVSAEIYNLYKKTNSKVKNKPNYIELPVPINQAFFAKLPSFEKLKPRALLAKVDGVIIAYSLLLQSDQTLFFKAVGLDYDLSYKTKAYFNLYYQTLKYASEQKCNNIDFGITSYEFKKWLGCEFKSAFYLCCPFHPLVSLFQKPIAMVIDKRINALF